MLLINEKCANMTFAFGRETAKADAQGKIEVKSKEDIEALLASGFVEVKTAKAEPKVEPKAEQKAEPKEKSQAAPKFARSKE